MSMFDLIQTTLSFSVQSLCNDCDASAFHAVTAAWAIKGYWMQAEMIHFLGATGLGKYASLLYIIAVGAGLIGYMLGNPPRNYLWYLFGPALFNILVFTTSLSGGVNWQLGLLENGSPDLGDQRQVWKMAEVGLLNMNIKGRLGMEVFADKAPTGGEGGKVEVAHLFLIVDDLVSDFVQSMIGLMGANYIDNPDGSGTSTNINEIDRYVQVSTAQFQQMLKMKWGMLQNITGASIKSPTMAKALGVFLGSECGDILSSSLDQSSFTAAARSKTGSLPESLFVQADYAKFKKDMDKMWIATPPPLRDLFKDAGVGAGKNSLKNFSKVTLDATAYLGNIQNDSISCASFFGYLIEAMRWESGNAYFQLIEQAPVEIPQDAVTYALFYGWGIRKKGPDGALGELLKSSDLKHFTTDLMLVHIVKNLFEYTPISPDQRYSPSEEINSYIELQQKTISSTTKYAEVYSWSLMIPYIQGLVLYFLAMAYPVVCVAMIMPGLHKLPLTWIKYWIWIKIWDLGFALVQAIERSVWAMMSNNDRTQRALSYVADMSRFSSGITYTCPGGKFIPNNPAGVDPRGCVDAVAVVDTAHGGVGGAAVGGAAIGNEFVDYIVPVFDRALALSVNLQLDLSNSYYIYIMAALYFAVPAIAGQLVGSAGGIASGALDKMTDVKGAAGAGYTSDMNQRMAGFAQSYGQEASFKAQRGANGSGFSVQALRQQNGAAVEGQVAGELDAQNSALGTGQQMMQHRQSLANAKNAYDVAALEKGGAAAQAAANGAVNAGKGMVNGARQLRPGAAAPGGGGGMPGGAAPDAGGGMPAGNGPAGAGAGAGAGGRGQGNRGRGPAGVNGMEAAKHGADALGHLGFAAVAAEKGKFDLASEGAKYDTAYDTTTAMAGAEAQKAQNSAGAAAARMNQGRMQSDAGRLSRAGSFAGSEAKWNAMNDLNTKLGGKLGVIGLNFSPFGAGGRSDEAEGGGYAGRLNYGEGAGVANVGKESAFFGNNGPMAGRISGFTGNGGALHSAVNSANGEFRTHGPGNKLDLKLTPQSAVDDVKALGNAVQNNGNEWRPPAAGQGQNPLPAAPAPNTVGKR